MKIDLNKMMTLSCQNSFSDFASRFDTIFQAVKTCYKNSPNLENFKKVQEKNDLILDLKTLSLSGFEGGVIYKTIKLSMI